jgi:aqualysin 1
MRRSPLLLLGVAAVVSACADDRQSPMGADPEQARLSAPAPLLSAANGRAVPGSYIVVLSKGANPRAVAAVARVEPEYVYTAALEGFAASLTPAQLNALRNHPHVEYVEENQIVETGATQTNATWGLDRIDQRDLPLNQTYVYDQDGTGVHAYIIDTGILLSHSQFTGRIGNGYDAVTSGGNANDCNGHGTHVAGTVGGTTHGVAKKVILHPVRVLSCTGSGTNAGVIAGMDWVAQNRVRPAVANMSLGGGASQATDDAVQRMVNAGVTVVVAAGNDNRNACNYSPARAPNGITVGSTTSTDARSSFSNFGTCVHLFAPGSSITSAWHTGSTATNTISGTSMAAPHVAGVAALYLQTNTGASPATVKSAILGNATTGKVTNAGTGSPNRLLHSRFDGGTPPPPAPTCSGTRYTGTLSGTGAQQFQPNGSYYQSTVSGTHTGCLEGPAAADFDLYLQKWNGVSWAVVARSEGTASSERITYSGTSGYYRWRIYSYRGSGAYEFWMTRP